MDPRERWDDPQEVMRVALTGWQRKMWTAMPGIVQDFDAADGTVSVQVALRAKVQQQDGTLRDVEISKLVKCPVMHFSGGGFSVTVPIKPDDEVLVIFASRSIDSWWQSGGVQNVNDFRMHDLSDGFAIPGVRSVPRALANWSTNSLQIRSDDGTTSIELADMGVVNLTCQTCNVLAAVEVNLGGINGPRVARVGDSTSGGDVIVSGSSKVKAV